MSSGIVGVVLWGTIIGIAAFLAVLGAAIRAEHRRGPRQHLREPVLKGWDQTSPPEQGSPERTSER